MKAFSWLLSTLQKRNPLNYARKMGVHIEGVKLIDNPNWGSEPYLIYIGAETLISGDVVFLTHDMSTRVYKNIYKVSVKPRVGLPVF